MNLKKLTPWKKSRTYGDRYGGRVRRKLTDNIFHRAHSLQSPGPDESLPILIQDNPSSRNFFPVTVQEFATALKRLPSSHREGITHIWLRRPPARVNPEEAPLAEFICGSGVRVIIIYPWPWDRKLCLGRKKPSQRVMARFRPFQGEISIQQGRWYVCLPETELKRFMVEHVFSHEVGHHIDWYGRHWSKANSRSTEEFANQYAVQWGAQASGLVVEPESVTQQSL